MSRKAKKSGPGSPRRKGPPPSQATRHRLGQHPGSQCHRIQGDRGRGRGLFPGRRVRGSSSFLGAQKWKVEEGLRNSAFCSRCCQGAGRREGVLRPRGGQCGRRAVDETGEAHNRLQGHRAGPRSLRGWGERGQSPLATHSSHLHSPPHPPLSHPQKCSHTLKRRQLNKQWCLAHLRGPDKSWMEAF